MHLGVEVRQPQYVGVWARERQLGEGVDQQPYQEVAGAHEISFAVPGETGGALITATPIDDKAFEIGSRRTVAIHTDAPSMKLRIVGVSGGMTIIEGIAGLTIEPVLEEPVPDAPTLVEP